MVAILIAVTEAFGEKNHCDQNFNIRALKLKRIVVFAQLAQLIILGGQII